MRRRSSTKNGYINLPQANFKNMIDRVQTDADVDTMKQAYVQYLGHRNILPNKLVDRLMMRALTVS